MSMLAERKRRTKWVNPGRQALWKQDVGGIKIGRELMKKMGWKIGQGLGVNNQGITEPLKISLKNDNKGMGYKGSDNEWIQQQSEFDSLLNKLSSSEPFPNKGISQDSKKDSVRSLEERSKLSKARLQYNKFTRGKDFTKYSKKDIECIVGCKKDLYSYVENQEDDINCKSHVEDTSYIDSGSMMDYFAKKMQYKKDSKTCLHAEEQTSVKNFIVKENKDVKEKELKKKEKSKSKIKMKNLKEYHTEDLSCNELVFNDSNDNNIKSDGDEKYNYNKIEDNPKYSPDRNCCEDAATRKSSKKKSKELEEQFLVDLEGDTSSEKLKKKKKDRKKKKCSEKYPEVIETLDDNKKANENSEGCSECNEGFDLTAKENGTPHDKDEELDLTIQSKKKKKKKRLRELENTEQTEKVKKKKSNLDEFNVIGDTDSEMTGNKKEQHLEKPKLTPNSSSLLCKKELFKTSNGLEKIQQNKILNLIYSTNIEQFNGSNLALVNGYGIIRCETES